MLIYLLLAFLIYKRFSTLKNLEEYKEEKGYLRLLFLTILYFIIAAIFSLTEYLIGKKFHIGDILLLVAGIILVISIIFLDISMDNKKNKHQKELDKKRREIIDNPNNSVGEYFKKNHINSKELYDFKEKEIERERKLEDKIKVSLLPGEEEEIPK